MPPARSRLTLAAAALCCAMLSGCAAGAARTDHDPLEPMNRKIFWFNDQVDSYVLEPVATGWDAVTPASVQRAVSRFFDNLRFPIVTANNLLQGKLERTGTSIGRFGINTTVGLLGFFDPAASWGLEAHPEDFGQTLGWWGVAPGAYLVLPFLGPSDVRDTVGLAADYAATVYPFFVSTLADTLIVTGAQGVNVVNERARFLKEVGDARAAALDYYVFVRNAYLQHRRAVVGDSTAIEGEREDDLYGDDLYDAEPGDAE